MSSQDDAEYDPVGNLIYATIVDVQTGGSPTLRRRLAIYDPATDAWIGATSTAPEDFGAGSEAEYLDGKIYVWPGLLSGGAVNGSNSFLYVFDIAANSWEATPSLQDFGVIPGFRSGSMDIWGIALTADHTNGRNLGTDRRSSTSGWEKKENRASTVVR